MLYIIMSYEEKVDELLKIHQNLKFDYGSFTDEFPEQVMSMMFLTGKENVLELGGNIGRNSMIIAYILNKNNNYNYVCLETNPDDAEKLRHNRDLNAFKFHIENAALSERKLIQQGWVTIPSDIIIPGHIPVNTLTWTNLQQKYKIDFDTLIIDCEGAFYYILQDTPEILNNIKLIIIENDYFKNWSHMNYCSDVFQKNNFVCVFSKDLTDPYVKDFYQVWKRL